MWSGPGTFRKQVIKCLTKCSFDRTWSWGDLDLWPIDLKLQYVHLWWNSRKQWTSKISIQQTFSMFMHGCTHGQPENRMPSAPFQQWQGYKKPPCVYHRAAEKVLILLCKQQVLKLSGLSVICRQSTRQKASLRSSQFVMVMFTTAQRLNSSVLSRASLYRGLLVTYLLTYLLIKRL